MSHEQPHERSSIEDTAVPYTAHIRQPDEPIEREQDWSEEPAELPRRPRRRLLSPLPLALLGVLLLACGFIGGVLVEKGESSSASSSGTGASAFASRLRGLRAGGSGTSAGASGSSSAPGGFARPTAGSVAYLDGSTLYVTNAEGNTIKVQTSAGTTVSKTVKTTLEGVHPGETVTVTGATGAGGAISAESISVGSSTAGGLASLLGASGGTSGGGAAGAPGARGGSSGGGQSLFGNGG